MKAARILLLAPMLWAAASLAQAVDYRSVGAAPAILYDTPSERGRKLAVAPRGMPVEVVLTYGDWVKVRDAGNDLSWLMAKELVPKRTVVVTANIANIHAAANESSTLAFRAARNVLLDLVEPPVSGWVRVRHADGATGYVKAAEVWGE